MQGHIHKRIHRCKDRRQSVLWYVVVDIGGDGRPRRQRWHGGFRTRREAEVVRARIVNSLHEQRYVAPSRLTLSDWVSETWLPMSQMRVKPTTLRSYRHIFESHVLPQLGERPIQKLTPREFDALYASLARSDRIHDGLSLRTICNTHRAIHKALADAVDAGVIANNPVEKAKPPRPSSAASRPMVFWRAGELAAFLDFVRKDRLYAVWRLLAMTGMRRGEVLGLRWGDIDPGASRISISRAVVSVDYAVLETTPKGKAARTVDLDVDTISLLAAYRAMQHREQAEWGSDYEHHELVVAWENGSPIHPDAFSHMFRALVRQAKLRPIRLHDLRHTHASLALQAGVPVTVISERLGHQSPAFTLSQYAHAIPGMQATAAATLAHMIRNEVPSR